MGNEKTSNLRCTECRKQEECSDIQDSLENFRCGLDGGHLTDACKVSLKLDGKPIFELKQVVTFGSSSKKDNSSKKDESSKKDDKSKDVAKEQ